MADFNDRKDKTANPIIEIVGEEGLLIVSRIVNFEHELRQINQDIPVNLRYEGEIIARLSCVKELWDSRT